MSTNMHSRIGEVEGRAGVERSEPGGRAELVAGGAPLPGGSRLDRELSEELVDQAIDRVRGGLPVGELPDELRERLTDGLIDELPTPSVDDDIEEWLRERVPNLITWEGWLAIDERERAAGEAAGRPRVKFVRLEDMHGVAIR